VCRFKVRVVYREAVIRNGDFRDSRWPGDGGGANAVHCPPIVVRRQRALCNENPCRAVVVQVHSNVNAGRGHSARLLFTHTAESTRRVQTPPPLTYRVPLTGAARV